MDAGGLKQLEIMSSSLAKEHANNVSSGLLNHQLALEGMALFLARVKPALMMLRALKFIVAHLTPLPLSSLLPCLYTQMDKVGLRGPVPTSSKPP